MKLQIFSDLHAEKGNARLAQQIVCNSKADVLIFAGDFCNLGKTGQLLKHLDDMASCPLLFVPGNHDYYGMRRETVDADLAKYSFENVITNESQPHL